MGYAVKLQKGGTQIYNDDKVNVTLSGSHSGTFTFSVCYVSKTKICLLSDTSMGTVSCANATSYSWNWDLKLGGKRYKSSDTGQSAAKIPTLENMVNECSNYYRGFNYGFSTLGYSGAEYWGVSSNYGGGNKMIWARAFNSSATTAVVPYISVKV